jgi:hypothetical protein
MIPENEIEGVEVIRTDRNTEKVVDKKKSLQ